MTRYREIEKKFVVKDYYHACNIVNEIYIKDPTLDRILNAETIDDYWPVPGKADFLRLRNSWGYNVLEAEHTTLKEITVKRKDKQDNTDRLEVNMQIGSIAEARKLLQFAIGNPIARIQKHEFVVFLGGHVVVSVCRVNNTDAMVEVEAPTVEAVEKHAAKIKRAGLELTPEPRSLFEIYVLRGLESEHNHE